EREPCDQEPVADQDEDRVADRPRDRSDRVEVGRPVRPVEERGPEERERRGEGADDVELHRGLERTYVLPRVGDEQVRRDARDLDREEEEDQVGGDRGEECPEGREQEESVEDRGAALLRGPAHRGESDQEGGEEEDPLEDEAEGG